MGRDGTILWQGRDGIIFNLNSMEYTIYGSPMHNLKTSNFLLKLQKSTTDFTAALNMGA